MGVWLCFQETLEIKSRNQRLASTGGGHHKVTETLVHVPFYGQLLQNVLLVGERRNFEIVGDAWCIQAFLLLQGSIELFGTLSLTIEPLKVFRSPIGFKGAERFVDDVGNFLRGDLQVPLKAVGQRRSGQVG